MTARMNPYLAAPGSVQPFIDFGRSVQARLEPTLAHLVEVRASQINGCAVCLDMHARAAREAGEREERILMLNAWRETKLFTPRERAALAWTEALTRIPEHGVPDELYERVRGHFSEKELSDLTFQIMVINAWNRANLAFLPVPGAFDKAWGLDKAGLS